jgi:threonine dehydratase
VKSVVEAAVDVAPEASAAAVEAAALPDAAVVSDAADPDDVVDPQPASIADTIATLSTNETIFFFIKASVLHLLLFTSNDVNLFHNYTLSR